MKKLHEKEREREREGKKLDVRRVSNSESSVPKLGRNETVYLDKGDLLELADVVDHFGKLSTLVKVDDGGIGVSTFVEEVWIAIVDESEVLDCHPKKRDTRGLDVAHKGTVVGVVVLWVDKFLPLVDGDCDVLLQFLGALVREHEESVHESHKCEHVVCVQQTVAEFHETGDETAADLGGDCGVAGECSQDLLHPLCEGVEAAHAAHHVWTQL